jgi:hypothetical protein
MATIVRHVVSPLVNNTLVAADRKATTRGAALSDAFSCPAGGASRTFIGLAPFHQLMGGRNVGLDHLRGIDDAIELGLADEAKLQRSFLEREIMIHGVVRDL